MAVNHPLYGLVHMYFYRTGNGVMGGENGLKQTLDIAQ